MTASGRLHSIRCAVSGVGHMLAGEPNARLHALATVAVLAVAAWLGPSRLEWVALVLAMALVWSAEAANTALEHLADALHPERHPLVGRAKDAAAAAVLLAALGAAAVGVLVLGPPLWSAFGGSP